MKNNRIIEINDELIDYFGIDFRHIRLEESEKSQFKMTEDGFIDEFGIRWFKPETSFYYEIAEHPLKGKKLVEIDDYEWPYPYDKGRIFNLKKRAKELYENTEQAISRANT